MIERQIDLAIADRDQWCPAARVSRMQAARVPQNKTHVVPSRPSTLHGLGVPDRDSDHEQAAERGWERTGTLFARTLR